MDDYKIEDILESDLLARAEVLYKFVDLFSSYEDTAREYLDSNGMALFTMNEVHFLSSIESSPGITVVELAQKTRRSKSHISQLVKKFENLECVIKVPFEGQSKKKQLFVTAKGKKLCEAHDKFDRQALRKTYVYLLRDCTPAEIDSFYKVMGVYNNIMLAAERKRARLRGIEPPAES